MRQRITFFTRPESPVDPALLSVTDTSLVGPQVEAAREDRITLALDELPADLQSLLASVHEIHIRWAAPSAYDAPGPLLSRVAPGFHLFYTQQKAANTATAS